MAISGFPFCFNEHQPNRATLSVSLVAFSELHDIRNKQSLWGLSRGFAWIILNQAKEQNQEPKFVSLHGREKQVEF